jgi:hypothetical protein
MPRHPLPAVTHSSPRLMQHGYNRQISFAHDDDHPELNPLGTTLP